MNKVIDRARSTQVSQIVPPKLFKSLYIHVNQIYTYRYSIGLLLSVEFNSGWVTKMVRDRMKEYIEILRNAIPTWHPFLWWNPMTIMCSKHLSPSKLQSAMFISLYLSAYSYQNCNNSGIEHEIVLQNFILTSRSLIRFLLQQEVNQLVQ